MSLSFDYEPLQDGKRSSLFPKQFDQSLRYLFVDMNRFYASIEQASDSSLLGRPVVIATHCGKHAPIIALSYEASELGVKRGDFVSDLPKGVIIKESKPDRYITASKAILNIQKRHFDFARELSSDEFVNRLPDNYQTVKRAEEEAHDIKAEIRSEIGNNVTCSIGIAANIYLAKLASELQKPDGLVFLSDGIEQILSSIQTLTDFPCIGPKTAAKLSRAGITNGASLVHASAWKLSSVFGKLGDKFYHMIRGDESTDYKDFRDQMKGHGYSRFMPPDLWTRTGAEQTAKALIYRAVRNLGSKGKKASVMYLQVLYRHQETRQRHLFELAHTAVPARGDPGYWLSEFQKGYDVAPKDPALLPYGVMIFFKGLLREEDVPLLLELESFPKQANRLHSEDGQRQMLETLAKVSAEYNREGRSLILPLSMKNVRADITVERISFTPDYKLFEDERVYRISKAKMDSYSPEAR